jgi:hypothetical protein
MDNITRLYKKYKDFNIKLSATGPKFLRSSKYSVSGVIDLREYCKNIPLPTIQQVWDGHSLYQKLEIVNGSSVVMTSEDVLHYTFKNKDCYITETGGFEMENFDNLDDLDCALDDLQICVALALSQACDCDNNTHKHI